MAVIRPVLCVALALVLSGCGASAGVGEKTPQAAVSGFLSVAGHPGGELTKLKAACRRLAPRIRERFPEPSETNCANALALVLFYTGDTGELEAPTGLSGKVTGVSEHGDRAVVEVAMSYEGADNPGADSTRVLTVREHGEWWIATPTAFSVRSASQPPTDAELDAQYLQLTGAAMKPDRRHQPEREAATKPPAGIDGSPQPCRADGASSARDATGDVKVTDGMLRAEQQPGSHDLTRVTHNTDGRDACFELRFAADAPVEGRVAIAVVPDGERVRLRWADGKAVREVGDVNPMAVSVDAVRHGSTMTFRLPKGSLGIAWWPYRWAVELETPTQDERLAHYDRVPDDYAYIRHGR